jgi:ribulose-5-phosphate 4-epimerase/fuculose-1-phosphate aldolase
MRVGKVPVVPYARPGAPEIAAPVARLAPGHAAVLIQNHGPVVSGRSLEDAVYGSEEVEEAAKIALLTRGLPARRLDAEALAELDRFFGMK